MQPCKMAKERGREETTPATPQPSDGDGKLQNNKKNPLRVLPLARTVNIFVGTRARARLISFNVHPEFTPKRRSDMSTHMFQYIWQFWWLCVRRNLTPYRPSFCAIPPLLTFRTTEKKLVRLQVWNRRKNYTLCVCVWVLNIYSSQ